MAMILGVWARLALGVLKQGLQEIGTWCEEAEETGAKEVVVDGVVVLSSEATIRVQCGHRVWRDYTNT